MARLPYGQYVFTGNRDCVRGQTIQRPLPEFKLQNLRQRRMVKAELIVWGDSLVHIINGDTVLQYSKPSMGGGVANRYNPAVWQPGKPLTEGYIALQSEGQPISFRNLFLKELK